VASLIDRGGTLPDSRGMQKAASFTLALGRLEPGDFHMVWNVWPLHISMIWMQLQNLDIKQEHHRQVMAKEMARASTPHI